MTYCPRLWITQQDVFLSESFTCRIFFLPKMSLLRLKVVITINSANLMSKCIALPHNFKFLDSHIQSKIAGLETEKCAGV
jgi:hypothetical protein